MTANEPLIPKHGGYRKLKSFQVAQLVFDITVRFCDRYIDKRSRTRDQMVQAARSGVQNIAEGSQASGTSKKTELKLTNVARASLEELRLDYEDFLRQRRLSIWDRDDSPQARLDRPQMRHCRRCCPLGEGSARPWTGWTKWTKWTKKPVHTSTKSTISTFPEIVANAAWCFWQSPAVCSTDNSPPRQQRLKQKAALLNGFTGCAPRTANPVIHLCLCGPSSPLRLLRIKGGR